MAKELKKNKAQIVMPETKEEKKSRPNAAINEKRTDLSIPSRVSLS